MIVVLYVLSWLDFLNFSKFRDFQNFFDLGGTTAAGAGYHHRRGEPADVSTATAAMTAATAVVGTYEDSLQTFMTFIDITNKI